MPLWHGCSSLINEKDHLYLSPLTRKPTMWFLNRSDTNRAAQPQKTPTRRSLKFRILKEEGLYFPSSENKGADQLRGYREADLRLCFSLCKLLVFSSGGSFLVTCFSNIKVVPVGMSRNMKKLAVQAKVPDLSKYTDISDYMNR